MSAHEKNSIITILAMVCVGGCGSVQGPGDPVANSPLRSGVYSGQNTCTSTTSYGGSVQNQTNNAQIASTITENGLPTWGEEEVREGLLLTFNTAIAGSVEIRVSEVTANAEGVFVTGEAESYICSDSCYFADDGECDEPSLCAVGTDCSDCGATEFRIELRETHRISGAGLERTYQGLLSDNRGTISMDMSCHAMLSP